jgi:hypothetical protein
MSAKEAPRGSAAHFAVRRDDQKSVKTPVRTGPLSVTRTPTVLGFWRPHQMVMEWLQVGQSCTLLDWIAATARRRPENYGADTRQVPSRLTQPSDIQSIASVSLTKFQSSCYYPRTCTWSSLGPFRALF